MDIRFLNQIFLREFIINKYINFFEKNKKTMCGIASGLSFLKKKTLLYLKDFTKIISHLNHRGPDSNGFYKNEM